MALTTHFSDVLADCRKKNLTLSRYFFEREIAIGDRDEEEILQKMERNLCIMEDAVKRGLEGVESFSGLSGGDE